MGLRFQRRVKIFGGFGINFSKSGMSWSIRGPGGTVGSKRYTIRTGIPGLTYVGGYSKRRRRNVSYSNHPANTESLNPIASTIITIIATIVVLYPLYFFIDFLFPSCSNTYKIISFVVIGIEVLYLLVLLFSSSYKGHESKTEAPHLDNVDKKTSQFKKEENKVLNIDLGYALTITNICAEIESVFLDFKNKYPISNPFHQIINFPNVTSDTFNTIPIFDLCQTFKFLGLEINEDKKERDILILCVGFFMSPKIEYTSIVSDKSSVDRILTVTKDFIFAINPFSSEELLAGPTVLEPDTSLRSEYIKKLIELLGVLTTVDFVLDKKENELLEILHRY